eukprot:6943707-Alexandrium_andersonii.AAC.1
MSGSAVQKSSQSSASGWKAHGGRKRPSAWKVLELLAAEERRRSVEGGHAAPVRRGEERDVLVGA